MNKLTSNIKHPTSNSAITLIALIITIIVLLILAGVTLNMVMGENGIFGKASRAKEETKIAAAKEKIQLRIAEIIDEKTPKLKIEDLIKIENEEIEVRKNEDKTVYSEIDEEEKQYALATCDGYTFKVYPNGKVELYVDKEIVNITFKRKKISEDRKQIDIVVTITGNKGLKKITKPDKTEVYPNQNTILLDYTVDSGVDYTFIAEGKEGTEVTKVINATVGDIYTIEDLENMSELLTENYRLMNDLDFEDKGSYATQEKYEYYNQKDENGNKVNSWLPIGNSTTAFTGSFDGNYNTISNLYINATEGYQGLFGDVSGSNSKIENLKVNNAIVNSVSSNVGGVVGYIQGSTISKVGFEGNVNGYSSVGGIAGSSNRTNLDQTYFEGEITGTYEYIGGIVGYASKTKTSNSYSTGIINSAGNPCGGIDSKWGTRTNCYTTAQITNIKTSQPIGIDGTNQSTFWAPEYSGKLSAQSSDGKKRAFQLYKMSTFENWDFENIWEIEEGNTTPYLKWAGKTKNVKKENINMVDKYTPKGNEMNGKGTEEEPFEINTVEQLEDVNLLLEANYTLINNLDLSSICNEENENWEPLGNSDEPFMGSFNGEYHTISNLYINTVNSYQGLFGNMEGTAKIKNLYLDNVNVTSKSNYIGGLVGQASGEIIRIGVNGNINGAEAVGGIIGSNSKKATTEELFFEGNVTGSDYVGGIVGTGTGSRKLLNCYSKGTLSAKTNNSGGIDGRFSYREKCYSISKLVYPNYSKPIGNDGTTSEDCFWAPDTSGSDINSTGKSTVEDMKKQETYTNVGWDFEKIWIMDTKTGYPRLQWENNIIH